MRDHRPNTPFNIELAAQSLQISGGRATAGDTLSALTTALRCVLLAMTLVGVAFLDLTRFQSCSALPPPTPLFLATRRMLRVG